jgi:hypothetical protein
MVEQQDTVCLTRIVRLKYRLEAGKKYLQGNCEKYLQGNRETPSLLS